MDVIVKFNVKSEGITRGLLMGHMKGEGYAVILNSSRLASVDLTGGILVGDLIGDGETWFVVGQSHPDIALLSIDVFVNPVFVTNFN